MVTVAPVRDLAEDSPATTRPPRSRRPVSIPELLGGASATVDANSIATPWGNVEDLVELERCWISSLRLRLAMLAFRLPRAPLPPRRIADTLRLIAALERLSIDRQAALHRDPGFGIWLGRAASYLNGATSAAADAASARGYAQALDDHLGLAPLRFLPLLHDALLDASPFPSRILPGGDGDPLGLSWGLRSGSAASIDADLKIHDRGATIRNGGDRIAEIPIAALAPGASGADVVASGPILRLHIRARAGGGTIEIGALGDYPEIAESLAPIDPETESSAAILGDDSDPSRIVNAVDRCLAALDRVWPEAGVDVRHFGRIVIPLRSLNEVRHNATHPGLPYVQAVTLNQGGDVERSESMLHEAMHTKLFMLNHITPLVRNDGPLLYRHPWRPDPRPIMGVFLGIHAFLAVLQLYRRALPLEPPGARRIAFGLRCDRLTREVGQALDELERGAEFTEVGREVAAGMREAYDA